MFISVDFDGTCVADTFPDISDYDIGSEAVLKELIARGHQILLFTMRSDEQLENAKDWFKQRNIELYGVNENPTQSDWTGSPKCYAHLYIDDKNLGIPLKRIPSVSDNPFVDWDKVRQLLIDQQLL